MRNPITAPPLAAIGLISAAALAYEILLTRIFAIAHWHHLVALAISLALLGYGASGTFLAVAGNWLKGRYAAAFIVNALLFSISAISCVAIAQRLPFDPQALTWDIRQMVYLAATFLVLAIPFFAAANCIGLTLWRFQNQIPRIYGMDLIGAGLGAFAVLGGLAIVHPAGGLFAVFLAGLLAALAAAWSQRRHAGATAILGLLLVGAAAIWARPEVVPAPYKDLARAMSAYGATMDLALSGVAGTVNVVRNDEVPLRHAPGLSLQTTAVPPQQLAVFVDGDAAGTLGDYSDPATSGGIFRDQLSALPYALRPIRRVAILNAGTGERVQQALVTGAGHVSAVEPNPELHELVCDRYALLSGPLCDPSRVHWHTRGARSLIAGEAAAFDLVTITATADAAGLDALRVDFDLTAEALGDYLRHLAPRGVLAIEGPTRAPPRLSMRMLATARSALEAQGITEPAMHIAMARAWQRFVLLVSRDPLDRHDEAAIRRFCQQRGFDLVWLPHIHPTDANRFQQLNRPQFYLGAAAILGGAAAPPEQRYRLAAVTDDRPFPTLSTTWSDAWQTLVRGERAGLAQLDAGLFIGGVTLALVTVASVLLIALPLAWLRSEGRTAATPRARIRTLGYFGLIGIAFLFLELGWIQRLQLFLGHPVYATTAVLAAFLIFAGLGSLWAQQRREAASVRALALAVATIVLFSLLYLVFLPDWLERLAGLPIVARLLIVLLFLAPLAFAMGIPFSTGLRRLGQGSTQLIPWAWGINGCASVISAAGAPLLATEIGFDGLTIVAVGAYLLLPLIRLEGRAA